jgi:hypothetical protein
VRVRAVARAANLVVYLIILLVYLVSYHITIGVGFVKMSGYQRQSAIALDRYDLEDRAMRELVFEAERSMACVKTRAAASGGEPGKRSLRVEA